MAHTPGPWRWWTSNSFRRLSSDASGKDGDVLHAVIGRDGWSDVNVSDADAALIAAAPDMLAALEDCDSAFVNWQVGLVPGRPEDILALIVKVRAAIAKATGQPPAAQAGKEE